MKGAARSISWEDDPLDPRRVRLLRLFFPAFRAPLAETMRTDLFAGEHTSRKWQGYMNGAVKTAARGGEDSALLVFPVKAWSMEHRARN
jgi:monoamine oxidase